jgi:hypothetical protein
LSGCHFQAQSFYKILSIYLLTLKLKQLCQTTTETRIKTEAQTWVTREWVAAAAKASKLAVKAVPAAIVAKVVALWATRVVLSQATWAAHKAATWVAHKAVLTVVLAA